MSDSNRKTSPFAVALTGMAALAIIPGLYGCLGEGGVITGNRHETDASVQGPVAFAVSAAPITSRTFTDASGRIQVRVKACDPTAAATTNCAYCTVDDGWTRIGGGAQILGESSPGAMLQSSFPDDNWFLEANTNGCTGAADSRTVPDHYGTWVARASGASHQLQTYVTEIRMLGNDGNWFKPGALPGIDLGTTIKNSPDLTIVDSPPGTDNEYNYIVGGGASIFVGDDNLSQATPTSAYLVGTFPVDGANGRAWRSVARSRLNPAPGETMKTYAIALGACYEQMAPTCFTYPQIRSVTAAAVSGYGTASATIPEYSVIGGIGGYAPASSGGPRYLADFIPLNGSSQGFTVRSKAYATGTGQTIGYAMTFGIPHDAYTAVYNHSNKCMGILSSRLDATAPVAQQTCTYGNEPANARFAMIRQAGGYVALKFEHSGMCLDVSGASTANSAAAIQYPCSFADNQLVQLLNNATGGHSFKFKHSGKCLDVTGASTADGARFVQYTCNGQANQAFHFDD
jgi:hypothetical protein